MNALSLLRRVSAAAAALLGLFVICLLLLHAMPGDPAERLDNPSIPAEQAERTRRALGLDRPLPEQLVRTLAAYGSGDFGVSFLHHRPVADVLRHALPATLELGAAALALAYGVGIALAVAALGLRAPIRRAFERLLLALAAMPRFWLGVMLILVLHGVLGWLPASHAASPGLDSWWDRLRHLMLPSLALGLPAAASVARYQLAAMERALVAPHAAAARARGAAGLRLMLSHVLLPSLGPVITLFGLDLPVLVSGAIVVEVVFAWPGVGRLTADAVLGADYPLALAAATLSGTVVVAGRLVAELTADQLFPERVPPEAG